MAGSDKVKLVGRVLSCANAKLAWFRAPLTAHVHGAKKVVADYMY